MVMPSCLRTQQGSKTSTTGARVNRACKFAIQKEVLLCEMSALIAPEIARGTMAVFGSIIGSWVNLSRVIVRSMRRQWLMRSMPYS